jgi:hypothetical protein
VIGIFKQKNPGNALLLLVYGLFLKFPLFLHPVRYSPYEGDNYIFNVIIRFLSPVTERAPILLSILAFLLLFVEASLLNRISNNLRLLPKNNFLPGMSYMLCTSLLPEWNYFSAPLLVNLLLIWIWYRTTELYSHNKPKTAIFNIAVLVGVLPLIYSPALIFILFFLFALLLTRTFDITEWLVALLGFTTPYYFLFVFLYLVKQWSWDKIIPVISFHLPKLPTSIWVTGGIVFLVIPFLIGAYFVQDNLSKMLIQVRKSWSLLLVLLIACVLPILFNPGGNYLHWLSAVLPLACFQAAAYYYPSGKWFPLLLHWVIFAFVVLLNYSGLR